VAGRIKLELPTSFDVRKPNDSTSSITLDKLSPSSSGKNVLQCSHKNIATSPFPQCALPSSEVESREEAAGEAAGDIGGDVIVIEGGREEVPPVVFGANMGCLLA